MDTKRIVMVVSGDAAAARLAALADTLDVLMLVLGEEPVAVGEDLTSRPEPLIHEEIVLQRLERIAEPEIRAVLPRERSYPSLRQLARQQKNSGRGRRK